MYPNLVAECKGYPLCGVSSDGLAMAANISFRDFNAVLNGDRNLSCVEAQEVANEMNRCREYRPEVTSDYLLSPTLTMLVADTDERKIMLHKMQKTITAFCNAQSGFDYIGDGRVLILLIDSSWRRTFRDLFPLFAKALNQAVSCAEFRYLYNCTSWAYQRLLSEQELQTTRSAVLAEIEDSTFVGFDDAVRFMDCMRGGNDQ